MGGRSKRVTVGYWYGIGFHMAVCYGPVDAMTEISVDDRVAWSGSSTNNDAIAIDKEDLFGGKEREGGIDGTLVPQFGAADQAPSGYLQAQIGGTVPAFRGVFSLIWRGIVSANNPYLKPWAITVRRILSGWYGGTAWYSAKATINTHDMNPAHIVYQCLTDPEWGMGYPTSSIDDANFRAVADVLYSEGFGLSLIWNQSGQIQSFIKSIMDHVGGILRVDPTTGKFILKLLRADYVAGSLPEYGPSQIAELLSYQRAAWGETVNEVTIVYTDPTTGKDTGVTVQDLANIQSQGAVVSQRISLPGIRSSTIATRVAMRELTARSTPLAKIKLTVNRNAWALLPGDVFKLTWPKLGLSGVIFRVLNVNTGTLESGLLTVDAAEDVFGLPASSYANQQPIGWSDPGSAPADAPNRLAFELPYWDLARTMTAADLDYLDPLDGYLGVVAQRPSGDAYDYNLWTRTSGGEYEQYGEVTHCPVALLSGSIGLTETTLSYTGGVSLEDVTTGGYLIIDGEFMALDAINTGAGTITVKRGVIDTVPATHANGAVIWFADQYVGADQQLYVDAEVVNAKAQTRTTRGVLTLASATEMTVTMNQRQARPYPPGQVRINGSAYPAVITGPLFVTWAHRDRLQQTAYIVSQNESDIGPEAGTSYRVAIVGEGSTTTTETEFSWCAPTDSTVTITLGSSRDGLDSWQDHSITVERAGWGYNWGKYWGGSPGAPDGSALVRCAPAWVYNVQRTATAIINRYDGAAGAYAQVDRATATYYYTMKWVDSNGAETSSQVLGYRLTGQPQYDSGTASYYFGLSKRPADPSGSITLGKIAASGSAAATFHGGDILYNIGAVELFGGKLWVGDGDASNYKLKRFTLSTMALDDTTTLEGTPMWAAHSDTRIFMALTTDVLNAGNIGAATLVAYNSSKARQWALTPDRPYFGLVYAEGWLWTITGFDTGGTFAPYLIRISASGAIDTTYGFALPADFEFVELPLSLVGGYIVCGGDSRIAGHTYTNPIIIDPTSGQQVARN